MGNELYKISLKLATVAMGGIIAYFAWRLSHPNLWLLLLLIPLWAAAPTRRESFLLILSYYLVLAWDAPGTLAKFDPEGLWFLGYAYWFAHAILLSALWLPVMQRRWLQIAIIIPLTVLPPLGALNWGHPILLAGDIFPGLGVTGLVITYFAMIFLAMVFQKNSPVPHIERSFTPLVIALSMLFLAFASNISFRGPLQPKWGSINTDFGKAGQGRITFGRHIKMSNSAKQAEGWYKVIVFPEGAGVTWEKDKLIFWRRMSNSQSIPIVGANIKTDSDITKDAAIDARTGEVIASARIPMPAVNWKSDGQSAQFNPFSSNVKTIDNTPTSFIFCYEETLVYPLMFDVIGGAKVIISMANTWSTAGTPARNQQRFAIEAQARLYGLPLVRAENI